MNKIRCVSGFKKQRQHHQQTGAALLAAMLTVTLVATFAAAALWQQWRSTEVESAERARVQSAWILTGALDWARLILREDARTGGADHLAEPWAVPLNEARLSSFLTIDKSNTGGVQSEDGDTFLSGQITDLQGRLNVTNLIDGVTLSEPDLLSFGRLFELLDLSADQLATFSGNLLDAAKVGPQTGSTKNSPNPLNPLNPPNPPNPPNTLNPQTPLMPQRIDELVWLGLSAETLVKLTPFITLLPARTSVNLNTASAEVIYATTKGLEMADAQKLVAARDRSHFRTLADPKQVLGATPVVFTDGVHSVASRFFEVRGRLRLDQTIVQVRSMVQRDGLNVRTLWSERGVVSDSPEIVSPRP